MLKGLVCDGNRKDEIIAQKMRLYVNGGGVKLPGLVKRRQHESAWFSNLCYPKCSSSQESDLFTIWEEIGATEDYALSNVSWKASIPIAKANGYENYTGTAAQNIELKNRAYLGILRRPIL